MIARVEAFGARLVVVFRVALAVVLIVAPNTGLRGQQVAENSVPVLAEDALRGDDVERRRRAAIATRSLDRANQRKLLPAMIEILQEDEDGQVRLAVLDTLTEMGPAAEPAIPALVHTLKSKYGGRYNEELHQDYRSALALAAIGESAVQGLVELLSEEETNVRAEAAMALGRIGPAASQAIEALVTTLGDSDQRVRGEASLALSKIGPESVEPLLEAVSDDRAEVRAAAVDAIGGIDVSDDRIDAAIFGAAGDDDFEVRAAAVRALRMSGISLERRRGILLNSLGSSDERLRIAAVNALIGHKELLNAVIPELGELIRSGDPAIAWTAAYLIQSSGNETTSTLISVLEYPDADVQAVSKALALIGPPAVPTLRGCLDDGNPRVRRAAVLALGQVRPLAEGTVEAISGLLSDPNRGVQSAALDAVGSLGQRGRPVAGSVRAKLHDPSVAIRRRAIEILFDAAPRDKRLIEDLTAMLGDPDAAVKKNAIDAIRACGPLGRSAIPSVILQLSAPEISVRSAALEMIASHGRSSVEAVPQIILMLEDGESTSRLALVEAIGRIGPAAQSAFEPLKRLMGDPSAEMRTAVVRSAADLGLPPETLKPFLADALSDGDSEVRGRVLRSIRQLGPVGTDLIPRLIPLAANRDDRRSVRRALASLERYGTDRSLIQPLAELLEHEDVAVVSIAARFLGRAGPAAQEVIPKLEELGMRDDEDLQAAVREAIAAIGSAGQSDDVDANP